MASGRDSARRLLPALAVAASIGLVIFLLVWFPNEEQWLTVFGDDGRPVDASRFPIVVFTQAAPGEQSHHAEVGPLDRFASGESVSAPEFGPRQWYARSENVRFVMESAPQRAIIDVLIAQHAGSVHEVSWAAAEQDAASDTAAQQFTVDHTNEHKERLRSVYIATPDSVVPVRLEFLDQVAPARRLVAALTSAGLGAACALIAIGLVVPFWLSRNAQRPTGASKFG